MRLNAPTGIHVVKKEEKEEKLRQFVERQLVLRSAGGGECTSSLAVVARSVASPVVKALSSIAESLEYPGIRVHAILVEAPTAAAALRAPFDTLQIIADPRFLEAHEQLVIDTTTAWIGDCMRREPNERDAYERYATDCAVTAEWARRTFDRLERRAAAFDPSALPAQTVAGPRAS